MIRHKPYSTFRPSHSIRVCPWGFPRKDRYVSHCNCFTHQTPHGPTSSLADQQTCKGRFTHSIPCPCRAHAFPLPCRAAKGLECVFSIWSTQCGRVWFKLHIFMNQTRPHCVNQMGKTHSKLLAARHGRGTAWARHVMCQSALKRRWTLDGTH
jgi:hypothetical protein